MLIYLIVNRPFLYTSINLLNIYNEFTLQFTFAVIIFMNLIDTNSDIQEIFGWIIIFMVFGSLLITWLLSIINTAILIRQKLSEKAKKRPMKSKKKGRARKARTIIVSNATMEERKIILKADRCATFRESHKEVNKNETFPCKINKFY